MKSSAVSAERPEKQNHAGAREKETPSGDPPVIDRETVERPLLESIVVFYRMAKDDSMLALLLMVGP